MMVTNSHNSLILFPNLDIAHRNVTVNQVVAISINSEDYQNNASITTNHRTAIIWIRSRVVAISINSEDNQKKASNLMSRLTISCWLLYLNVEYHVCSFAPVNMELDGKTKLKIFLVELKMSLTDPNIKYWSSVPTVFLACVHNQVANCWITCTSHKAFSAFSVALAHDRKQPS